MNNIYVIHALLAAALFGASTRWPNCWSARCRPGCSRVCFTSGAGLGLAACGGWCGIGAGRPSGLTKGEWPWLLGAIFFGGVVGPLALMFGLTRTSGSTASLLLNLEAVLTAVIAWVVFRRTQTGASCSACSRSWPAGSYCLVGR